ncbi:MAG: extracellular solute-binding protein [Caldilineaceae bacterium]|nr:extracellular solute-binding protein [Caldilineaceae bacterium]
MSTQPTLTRRHFLFASATVATGALLAACAAPSAAPAPSGDAAGAPAGELIELTLLGPDRELGNNVRRIVVDRFNAQMEADGKPWRVRDSVGPATDNDLRTKLTLDAAAGTLPDLFNMHSSWVADFVAAGYLLDMGPYLEQWADWDKIYDVLKPLATYEGKIVGIPGGTTFTWYYRKDVLEGAGIPIDQPQTWDDFFAVCDQVKTKTDAVPCGLPGATPWGGGTWAEGFRMVWLGFDGPIFDEADGKWVVSSPNLLKALQVYETLAQNGWLTVDELLTPNPWEPIKYQMFPAGDCTLVTGGDWQWEFDWGPNGATPIEGLFERVDRWQFPAEDGNAFTYVEGSVGTGAAANTKSPEGCAEYVTFSASNDVNCETLDVYVGGPTNRRDFADACPAYTEVVNGKMHQASELFETGRTYKFERTGTQRLADGIARATEDIITGTLTAEQAMEAFADAMIEGLGEEMAKKA